MDKSYSGAWEFLALEREIISPNGVNRGSYLVVTTMRIGDSIYGDTIIATGYPLFAQLPETEFDNLQSKGYIRNIQTADEYTRWYNEMVKKVLKKKTEPAIDEITNDDPYNLGLDDWKNYSAKHTIEGKLEPIMSGERLHYFYPFSHIGYSDVNIMGRYAERTFTNVSVTKSKSKCVTPLLGMEFISLFPQFAIGWFEEYERLAAHGIIEF